MPFLVRKLNKRDQLNMLVEQECIQNIYADVPTSEFRTTKGALSTWIIDSLEFLDNAVLAIAVSSSKISKMDFIVIDMNLLEQNDLQYRNTDAGMEIPIPDLQDKHYDIENVSLGKLVNCANVYKQILSQECEDDEKYIVRFTEAEIKEKLKKAIIDNRVDRSKASKAIREVIDKLSVA